MHVRRPLLVCLLLVLSFASLAVPRSFAAPLAAPEPRIVDEFNPPLLTQTVDANGVPIGFFTAQDGNSTTTFSATSTPPAPVPGAAAGNSVLKMDFTVVSFGVVIHDFESAAGNAWVSQDWSPYAGFDLWVHGSNSGTTLFLDVLDNRNPGSTKDDAERFSVTFKDDFAGWQKRNFPFASFARKEIGNGAPNDGFGLTEVWGWAFGALTTSGTQTFYADQLTLTGTAPIRPLTVGFAASSFPVVEGGTATVAVKLSKPSAEPVTVKYTATSGTATDGRDFTATSGTLQFPANVTQQSFTVATIDDAKDEPEESVLLQLSAPTVAEMGVPAVARVALADNDAYNPALLDDFELGANLWDLNRNARITTREIAAGSPQALPGQGAYENVIEATSATPGRSAFLFGRRFAAPQNWSDANGLSFMYYGRNTGRTLGLQLLDNAAPDQGPGAWSLAWSDEFNARAGTQPNPENWGYELGDGTANGNPGWGNSELEYYTNQPENAATDGQGNLAITVRKTAPNSTLSCYYGPCQYTSARLLTKNRAEFAYGRIEARLQVPRGAGLWPAFWSLGTDIDRVNWPQTGEVDYMEHVGREPYRVFGTIHGPGYSGGDSFGGVYDLQQPVADAFHTFTVEWQPDRIVWFVDGIRYHEADPADVAPDQWVFNHPFFMLLNVAVGGNFGGPVGPATTFPQTMKVDYVRVYQAPDTAERFEAPFVDNFTGWRKLTVPFTAFKRSVEQPAGAPNDGLTLSAVNGYGFFAPGGLRDSLLIDQVRLDRNCTRATVTSAADNGPGSLRAALDSVCDTGTITFAAGLAGQTIKLTSGELALGKSITLDASAAPGVVLSGGGTQRIFVVNPGVSATLRQLTVANGFGYELAGAILNNGALTLDHVTVANSAVTTSNNEFWKGGGGVYSGENSVLTIVDSTIRDNSVTGNDGGGIFAMFNAQVTLERSTISGNRASNVGGGIRMLGNATIRNSTISGNTGVAWHGGGMFLTDGTTEVVNSTITANTGGAGTAGGIAVATFGPSSATLRLANSIVAGNNTYSCEPIDFGGGSVTITSLGHNIASDPSCSTTAAGDQIGNPLLGALASNGGPTQTHALLAGSPARDTADGSLCPPVDQRGVTRPQGAGCDIGAFEAQP